jgi:transposase
MFNVELTLHQRWELRGMTRAAVGRVAMRALMVLWRAEGLTTLEIGQRLDCHRDTISLWIERYRTHGPEGLKDETRPGRPPRLSQANREHAEALLEQPPPDDAAPRACWTLPRLRAVLLGVTATAFCLETLRRIVHQLGFRFRRPRLWAHQHDPETFEKQLLMELAKQHATEQAASAPAGTPTGPHFLYGDASDHHLLAVLRSMWMRRGQQVRVATPPRNGHWALFGCLNVATGRFLWQAYEKAITEAFLQFLEHLLECYPQGEILLAVDNAAYHTSHATVAWLKAHPRIVLLYLPARRPDLNPMERIWNELKDAISANRSFANLLALGQFVQHHFASLSTADFLRQAGVRSNFCEAT